MSALLQDLRYGALMARKSPGVSALAVATLALGIGLSSAIFGVAHNLVFRDLPFPAPERLMALTNERTQAGDRVPWSWNDLRQVREETRSVQAASAYAYDPRRGWAPAPQAGGGSQHLSVIQVADSFFETLGVEPLIGRTFTAGGPRP